MADFFDVFRKGFFKTIESYSTKVWGLSIDRPIGDETHVYNLTVFPPRRVEANGCQNLDLEGTSGKVTSNHVLFLCIPNGVCL